MKRTAVWILVLVFTAMAAVSAAAKSADEVLSTLIVHSEEGGVHVFIDGRLKGKMDVTSHDLSITGIEPGKHLVRITDFTEMEIWWEGIVEMPEAFTARAIAEPGQFSIYNLPREIVGPSDTQELPSDMLGMVEFTTTEAKALDVYIDMKGVGMIDAKTTLGPLETVAGEHYVRVLDPVTGGLVCSALVDVRPGATLVLVASRGKPLSSPSRPRAVIPGF